eukprot:Hpha_TRINITY_DN16850_c1_g2::TRINITY_DN16850_c1_g2_i12::g.152944::m.152944
MALSPPHPSAPLFLSSFLFGVGMRINRILQSEDAAVGRQDGTVRHGLGEAHVVAHTLRSVRPSATPRLAVTNGQQVARGHRHQGGAVGHFVAVLLGVGHLNVLLPVQLREEVSGRGRCGAAPEVRCLALLAVGGWKGVGPPPAALPLLRTRSAHLLLLLDATQLRRPRDPLSGAAGPALLLLRLALALTRAAADLAGDRGAAGGGDRGRGLCDRGRIPGGLIDDRGDQLLLTPPRRRHRHRPQVIPVVRNRPHRLRGAVLLLGVVLLHHGPVLRLSRVHLGLVVRRPAPVGTAPVGRAPVVPAAGRAGKRRARESGGCVHHFFLFFCLLS